MQIVGSTYPFNQSSTSETLNNNLPVVILKEWDELNEISETKLNEWYQSHINKTNINNIFPKLTFNYWIK